jgi:curli biogenesis system outer membrane secretion channel CsgG
MLFFSLVCLAQSNEDKKIVAITPFSSAQTISSKAYSSSATEVVVSAFVNSNRFTVVDRTSFDALMTEENLQKGESFIDGIVVEQGKKLGAQYIVTGNLTNASAEPVYTTVADKQIIDKQTGKVTTTTRQELSGYRAQVAFSIKILDVETGKILGSGVISNRSGNMWIFQNVYGSEGEAISMAIKNSQKEVLKFIDKQFPVQMTILEISESTKTKAKKVVVTAGRNAGLSEKQDLKVYEVTQVTINGQVIERNKPIAEIRIISVDDDNFSTCVVRDGGEAIKEAITNKKNIVVMSGQ